MTPDLPIPEAAREAAVEAMAAHYDDSDWVDRCHCDETFRTSALLQQHIADAIVAAALPHLRSLQVETQLEYGRALGRKEAAEEIAAQIAAELDEFGPRAGDYATGMNRARRIAVDIAQFAAGATSEPRTDLPVGPSHPKDSETAAGGSNG